MGQQLFGTFTLILQAAETYALPRASAIASNRTLLIAGLQRMTGTLLVLYIPFALLLCLFSNELFELLGGTAVTGSTKLIAGLAAVYMLVTVGYAVRTAMRSLQLNKLYFFGACLSAATTVLALTANNNVLIGTTTDIASSKLTVESTTQGFLPPRLTSAQRDLIATPAAGLMVYNTTDNRPSFYNGTSWINL